MKIPGSMRVVPTAHLLCTRDLLNAEISVVTWRCAQKHSVRQGSRHRKRLAQPGFEDVKKEGEKTRDKDLRVVHM